MENYFVISNSDGNTTIKRLSKSGLLEMLESKELGQETFCYNEVPENTDTNYWGNSILIIKGTVVTPRKEEVITKYNID